MTIHRTKTIRQLADERTPYDWAVNNPYMVVLAMGNEYPQELIHPEFWALLNGAYGESNGPT